MSANGHAAIVKLCQVFNGIIELQAVVAGLAPPEGLRGKLPGFGRKAGRRSRRLSYIQVFVGYYRIILM